MPDAGRHPSGFRPPWWPEGEPFPPDDRRAMRSMFVRRALGALAFLFVFLLVVGWLGAVLWHGPGFEGRPHGGPRPFVPGLLLFALAIVGFLVFGRAVRRTTRPIGDVMDAAERVANGDYAARAPVYGPREVRDLAESFNEMAARIEAGERQRRNLVADVSHELRTPLSVIQGRVEGIVDGVYAADAGHLELVLDQTRVLARLLDDLLVLSRAEAGALALEREAVSPHELVDAVVDAYRDEAAERAVRLEASVADGLPEIDVDRVRVGEVLSNLVTNALRYTPREGSIAVSASAGERGVVFEVSDAGPGIAADELAHVFDRFTKSAESRGSGLGLAIARSLVEAHGGSITVRSDGSGTTFRFVLPTGRRQGTSTSEPSTPPERRRS
jgi:signal transduction histidine kinase